MISTLSCSTRSLSRSAISAISRSNKRQPLHSSRVTMAVTSLEDDESVPPFLEKNKKAILYFTAGWCPPCKMIKPIYSGLSDEYDHCGFGMIDVDEVFETSGKAGVTSIPAFHFMEDGKKVSEVIGADQDALRKAIENWK